MDALQPGYLLDADDALVARLVREPRRPDDVADGIEPGLAGAAAFVDDDVALLDFDARRLEPEVFDVAGDADGEDDASAVMLLLLPPSGSMRAVTLSAPLGAVARPWPR